MRDRDCVEELETSVIVSETQFKPPFFVTHFEPTNKNDLAVSVQMLKRKRDLKYTNHKPYNKDTDVRLDNPVAFHL